MVPRRNKLAHGMLKRVDGRPVIADMTESFSVEDMTKLRREFIEHRDNFSMIAVLLDVKLD